MPILALNGSALWPFVLRDRGQIMHVRRLPVDDGAARDRASTDRNARRLRNRAILSRTVDEITVNLIHDGVACLAQARRILRHGIQHGGEIRWRASDDT